jgi:acetylornithine/N-succinyldiaminopimelate aminotransferase
MRDNNLLGVAAGENVVRLIPPLIVTAAEIDEAVARFDKALAALTPAKAG